MKEKPQGKSPGAIGGSVQRSVRSLSVDELTRLAFIWAEQDRAAMAEAWAEGTPERAEAENQYQQLKAYRTKRWGRTQMEAILEKPMKTVSIFDLKDS